ncbi:MAG: trypsin-like peptidase domain-containing protein [Pirellulales bacterium]|nr:trypsin-like peptidase domain-containing protein [Pirellulales bacterium]
METTASQPGFRRTYLVWILLGLLLALILPNLVERIRYSAARGEQRGQIESARQQLAKLADTSEAFRLVAQSVGPCVVHINTTTLYQRGNPYWSGEGRQRVYAAQGQGSGVIVDPAGYVVTNNHVVENASRIEVLLSDGRTIGDVQLVGADPLSDLAVVKIDADQLPTAPWGDSDKIAVGDWVLAVGNPYGLDRSVTAGIISATGRRVHGGSRPLDFLQTDAAVNPGNSGGPLVNLRGEVIGITTAIVGPAYQGISFAIPSNYARDVYDRLRKGTVLARGWLGVALDRLSPDVAMQMGLNSTRGALVSQVEPGSPAAKAGIETGDVIRSWDGEPIDEPDDLILLVGQTEIGKAVEARLLRFGRELTVRVTVEERQRRKAER